MPRFVILEHDHPHRHWDFMLEAGDMLRTWRLARPPQAEMSTEAEALGDHRRAYLDYEGPVSGGRGTVQRWDRGMFDWVEDGERRVSVDLRGERWSGRVELIRRSDAAWEVTFKTAST